MLYCVLVFLGLIISVPRDRILSFHLRFSFYVSSSPIELGEQGKRGLPNTLRLEPPQLLCAFLSML